MNPQPPYQLSMGRVLALVAFVFVVAFYATGGLDVRHAIILGLLALAFLVP